MTGKAKELFDLWEADRDHTDLAKSYEELSNKVKDYARKRELDSPAHMNMQHGSDPMDVGTLRGDWSEYYNGACGGYDGYKGKGKFKSEGP